MSNLLLNKLKSAIKKGTKVTLSLSSNFIRSSNDKTNFPNKLLLTDTQVSKIRKAFANGSSANIKLSKIQLPKIVELGGFMISAFDIINLINPFKTLPKIINKADELSKKVILSDTIKTVNTSENIIKASKNLLKVPGTGITLTNNEIKDIMKVIKSLENRGILLKGTTRKITSQEGGFLSFLRPLMTTGLSFMNNIFTPLAKNVLLPVGLSAGMSATDAASQN